MPPLVIQIFSPLSSPAAVGILDGLGADRGRIRSRAGLGQAKRRDHFAAGQLRQISRSLLGRAEQQYALHADRAVRADGERHRTVVRAALAQDARVAGIRQAEAAMLLGNDQAEQPQIAQTLNEFRRLFRRPVPPLEILMPGRQELVDGIDHHAQDFAVLVAQPRIGKQLLFEYSSRHQILCDAHRIPTARRDRSQDRAPRRGPLRRTVHRTNRRPTGVGWPLKDTRAVIETRCPLLRTRPGIMESAGDR